MNNTHHAMAGIKGDALKLYDHRYHTPHKLVSWARKCFEGVPSDAKNGAARRRPFKLHLPVAIWNYIAAFLVTRKVDMVMKFVKALPHMILYEHQLNWVHFLSNNFHQSNPAACITGPRQAERTTTLCVWASAEARIFPGTRIRLVALSQRGALAMHQICNPMVRDAYKHGVATWVLDNASVIECTSTPKPTAQEFSVVAFDDRDMIPTEMKPTKAGFSVAVVCGLDRSEGAPMCSLVRVHPGPGHGTQVFDMQLEMRWSEKADELAAPVKKLGFRKDTL